jgi:hypothetical protein
MKGDGVGGYLAGLWPVFVIAVVFALAAFL